MIKSIPVLPQKKKKECIEGKEINPITGRCVLKCKDDEVRNIKTGKCQKKIKECLDGKEINPITGRCVKRCKDDEDRNNNTGKCQKKIHVLPQKKIPVLPKNSSTSDDPDISLYYPDVTDENFPDKIASNMNFAIHKIPKFPIIDTIDDFNNVADKLCSTFETSLYQHFVSQYLSYKTPYKSILLYHGVGVGKTCSAITMSEALLLSHDNIEPMIWVIMPQALKQSFKKQIFDIDNHNMENLLNQCTGDTYVKLLNIFNSTFGKKKLLNIELKRLLKFRYRLFTYDSFAKYIDENYKDKKVENKVIIVDEAHNIRSTNKKDKYSFLTLSNVLETGISNKLVLLSATPMYNEPRDILDLFKLMLLNDKRVKIINNNTKIFTNKKLVIDDEVIKLIKKLSSTYVSYLRGKNPFTFALKLNPENSGIPVLKKVPIKDPSNKIIPKNELNWLNNIDNGIVTSNLSISQKAYIDKIGINKKKIEEDLSDDIEKNSDDSKEKSEKNENMKLLQPMNIVYGDEIGNKGFFTFFTKTRDTDPLLVKYTKKYENALMPTPENLGNFSGKFLTICDIIKKSKGVIVIYSRFLYSGILPFAVCLEHMGYSREGANNILSSPNIIENKPIYENIKSPKYCILTSDNKEIMGSTNIDTLINKINKPENINGELIKVILITPVASEGLSFYNAREIHLIEPWYHFNRPEQIIGRGIRNCRHQNLPLDERNTTVYMHSSKNDDENRETIDIHALRISTRKYIDSTIVDKIIRDNSIDCILMKNINYFPKSIFNIGKIKLKTSQNKIYEYDFGDELKYEPECKEKTINLDHDGYNIESYKHLLKRTQNSLKEYLLTKINKGVFFIDYDEIRNTINIDDELLSYTIRKSIYPYNLLNDYFIILHNNGIKIINNSIKKINKLNIIFDKKDIIYDLSEHRSSSDKIPYLLNLINIDITNINSTTVSLYLNLDNTNFILLIKSILKSNNNDDKINFIEKCLYKQGVLIKKEEIPSYTKNSNKYIGYVNIYDINNKTNDINKIDINIYSTETKKFENASKRMIDDFFKSRKKKIELPFDITREEMPWGVIEPVKNKETIINKFKIYSTDPIVGKGKKTGRVCDTYQDIDHNKFINQINKTKDGEHKYKNKKFFCNVIANKLMDNNKLILLPLYKPK
tara:strand:- start:16186 stop:19650 length:3465 start_codon:yes stop_codon:yes gene_type:complete